MSGIFYVDVQDAYAASGLTPCRCGPEWHRLPGDGDSGGKIGAGPFLALYCHASWLVVTPAMSDAALDALAEAAERWARREWGVEYYAAFQAGFEHAEAFSLEGALACTPLERRGLFEGKLASQMLGAIPAPATSLDELTPASVVRFPERYRRKAGVAC